MSLPNAMQPSPLTADVQALLDQMGWLRELAKQLVGDPHRAEDLTQEACLAALQHRPMTDRSLRGWLATVLRNLVRQGARGDGRRSAREESAAQEEATSSTLDLFERVSTQRRVADAVTELDEPYRTTLLLRYFEGRTPQEIARTGGISVSTVKTRLARGLAQLRERLDREYGGDGRAWLLALIPLSELPTGGAASAMGALLVSTQVKIVVAAALVAVGIVFVWPEGDEPGLPGETLAAEAEIEAPLESSREDDALAALPLENPEREAAAAAPEEEPTVEIAAPIVVKAVEGRVLSELAVPLSGVPVRLVRTSADYSGGGPDNGEGTLAVSTAGGHFRIEDEEGWGRVFSASDEFATVYSGVARRQREKAVPIVVVAPRNPLGGRVIDEAGRAIEGATVEFRKPEGFHSRFDQVMDFSDALSFRTSTDPEGRFDLDAAPRIAEAELHVQREGYLAYAETAPELPDTEMLITLRRTHVAEGTLSGRVIDSHGAPVPDARVALGVELTRTDEYGLFHFDLTATDSPNRMTEGFGMQTKRIVALKEGFQPVRLDIEPEETSGEIFWPEDIVLTLGDEPLEIAGRVVDAEGKPLAGVDVWVTNMTLLSMSRSGREFVENILDGAPGESWRTVETDASGAFRLGGLEDREYSLAAMNGATLLRTDVRGIAAGRRGVELVLDQEKLWKTVAGRVVSKKGVPIAGVVVRPMMDGFRTRYQGQVIGTSHSSVEGTTTDDEGYFELLDVPQELVYLRLDSEDIISLEYGRTRAPEPGEDVFIREGSLAELSKGELAKLEIVVPLRVHMKVTLESPEEADQVAVLDASGAEITINVIMGGSRFENERIDLTEGVSDTLTVTDSSETLVLYKAGEVVRSIQLDLIHGELNEITP